MSDPVLVGRFGTVVNPVRGGRLPGEIRVLDFGEPIMYIAYCDDALDVGRRVQIIRSRGSRQVDVKPWP